MNGMTMTTGIMEVVGRPGPRTGANGIYPRPGNDHYPNNMDTRMIYGPFDLSDAVRALTQFYLWRDIEVDYDYLTFEISRDGIAFQELARWSDERRTWELQSRVSGTLHGGFTER